jgi:hypothetical protein
MKRDTTCSEFQKQHSFSYTHILDLAKISSSSYFFKGLKGIKGPTDFTEPQLSTEFPRCLSSGGKSSHPLIHPCIIPIHPSHHFLKRKETKTVPYQHSNSPPLPLTCVYAFYMSSHHP